ncbi:MAG: restriction endonuclease subunit S, partial [Shewanella sp.]
MSQWEMVKLRDVCKITSGGTPNRKHQEYFSGSIPWVKTGDLKQKYISTPEEFITELGVKNSAAKIFPKGTVLIALYGATIGACSILSIDATTNQACGAILPSEKILPEYLYLFLLSHKQVFISQGVGGAQPNISGGILKDTLIPLPPLDIQKQIVARLDLAQALVDQRKQQLGLMDALVQSTFYEMFGDPVKNEKRWEIKPLSLLSKKITDGTHQSPNWADNGHPFIFVSNIRNHEIDFNTSKFVSQEEAIRLHKGCKIEIGDVLLTVVGSYGYSARVKDSNIFAFQRHIAHIKPLPGLMDSVFLERLLSSMEIKGYIDNVVTGIAQKTLTLSELKKLPTIVPPLTLQQQFAT